MRPCERVKKEANSGAKVASRERRRPVMGTETATGSLLPLVGVVGRERRRHKIPNLPKKLREELERKLREEDFESYRKLSKWLADKGYAISHAALQNHHVKFEQHLEAIKLATAQAREIVAASPDDDNQISEALMRLVQTSLFEVLVELRKHRARPTDEPKRKTATVSSEPGRNPPNLNLAVLGRTVANLGRAAIAQKKWIAQTRAVVREKVGEAKETLSKAEKGAGLSGEAAEKIRAALAGIEV